jgi:DNA-binding transcriptional LysR family regulator
VAVCGQLRQGEAFCASPDLSWKKSTLSFQWRIEPAAARPADSQLVSTHHFLPEIYARPSWITHAGFPDIALHVIESSRTRLITALRNGAIDVAVVTGEAPLPNSKSIPLWSERILVVLPEGHRLAASETIHWTDLKGETFLLSQRDPGSEIQDLLTARLVSPADRPKVVRHDISRESIKSLIGAGFGIGLTLEASLGAVFSGVIHREARDGTGPVRIDHFANWRDDNENPALAAFLKLLGERYPSPSI